MDRDRRKDFYTGSRAWRLRAMWSAGVAALALAAVAPFGCGSGGNNAPPSGAYTGDAGTQDTGAPASLSDAGVDDAGVDDAGVDAGPATLVNVTQPCSNGLELEVSLLDDGVARF